MGKVIRPFCWHQNFVPRGGCLPLPRGYIYVLNHEKHCIKSDFKDIFFETCNKWMKWQDISVDIKTLSPRAVSPCPGAIYMYQIMKKLYKIRLQRDFFWNLQQMTKVTRCSCWHKKFVHKGLSALALGLYTCLKQNVQNQTSKRFFETCSKWPKRQEVSVDINILSPGVVYPWPAAVYIY